MPQGEREVVLDCYGWVRRQAAIPFRTAISLFLFVGMSPLLTLGSQTIKGRVTVGGSELPARGVGVILVDSTGRPRMAALADSFGVYQVTAPKSGIYRLRVQGSKGLIPHESAPFTLAEGIVTNLNVSLFLTGTVLDTVRISSSRLIVIPPGNQTKFDEFLRRRNFGFGRFLTRGDIEKKNVTATRDLLRGIPGMLVSESMTGPTIQSKRCSGGSIPGMDAAALTGGSSGPDRKQQPMLFVDGIRIRDIASLSDIHPNQIEAMEVYQGASEVPAEAKGDACAAIFIWLKSGR